MRIEPTGHVALVWIQPQMGHMCFLTQNSYDKFNKSSNSNTNKQNRCKQKYVSRCLKRDQFSSFKFLKTRAKMVSSLYSSVRAFDIGHLRRNQEPAIGAHHFLPAAHNLCLKAPCTCPPQWNISSAFHKTFPDPSTQNPLSVCCS